MKRYLLLFTMTFSLFGLSAQNDSTIVPYKNQIKISPLRTLLDIANPGIEIAYERRITAKFSTQLTVAHLNNFLFSSLYNKIHGYRISLEPKFYFCFIQDVRLFFSMEMAHSQSQYTMNLKFRKRKWPTIPDGPENYWTDLEADKNLSILNVKFGLQIKLERILVELSGGLGIKNKNITLSKTPEEKQNYRLDRTFIESLIVSGAYAEGSYGTLTVPFNIKFGYRF